MWPEGEPDEDSFGINGIRKDNMTSLIDWTKFPEAVQKVLGDMQDEKPTPKHIEAAIEKCNEINNMRNQFGELCRWAIMEVIPTHYRSIVRVDWGHIRFDGRKEVAIETINYDLDKNGNVTVSKHVHS